MVSSTAVAGPRSLTALVRDLPAASRVLVSANFVSAIGNGLTLPYLAIYLGRALGYGTRTATLAVAVVAAASLAGGVLGGRLADGWNRRATAAAALLAGAGGSALFAVTHSVPVALAGTVVYGLGMGGISSYYALFVSSAAAERRQALLGLNFGVMNAGIGIGTLIGSLVVNVHSPGTFRTLYSADALSFTVVAAAVLLATRGRHAGRDTGHEPGAMGEQAGRVRGTGYAVALRDRRLVLLVVFSAVITAASYGQISASLPILATGPAKITAGDLGLIFLLNTIIVVIAQVSWLRRPGRAAGATALRAACLLWAVSWVCVTAGTWGAHLDRWIGLTALVAGMILFALAEPFFGPIVGTAVNDLAPEEARGRYNSVYGLSTSAGFLIGPALATCLLPLLRSGFGLVPAGLCLAGALAANRLPWRR
jgi:MFS family permease